MSTTSGAVSVLSVLSVHGVPMLIRCIGSAAPPRREVVGILNAVFQAVRQQALGTSGEGAGRDAAECVPVWLQSSQLLPLHLPLMCATWRHRPALLLQQLRSTDARVTFRSYAPADILLVLMQNGGATQSDADGGGALSLLDMCYQAIVLLNGEYEGMRAAKDNPQSFQRRLRVRVHANSLQPRPRPARACQHSATACLSTRVP
jgi:hypothetical protein